jgi:flotillin
VWDSGSNSVDGKNSTANFISGMMKSVPPLNEVFSQAGMDLPKFLGESTIAEKLVAAETELSSEKGAGEAA